MKVLVNGCSHLEGTELHPDFDVCPTLTWPNFVNNWSVTNIAQAASSNDSITRRTINELEQNAYDFVYVQWSYFDRIELQIPDYQEHGCEFEWFCINSHDAHTVYNLNQNKELMNQLAQNVYLKQFNDQWRENYSLSQIIVLQTYLKFKNIPYMFGFAGDEFFKSNNPRANLLDQFNLNTVPWEVFCKNNHFKKLIWHFEHAAHHAYADLITQLVKDKL